MLDVFSMPAELAEKDVGSLQSVSPINAELTIRREPTSVTQPKAFVTNTQHLISSNI